MPVKKTETTLAHSARCSICKHPERQEIEREFTNWSSPNRIAKDFSLTKKSLYRHVHAAGLMVKRQENVRRALEKIIEFAGEVKPNAYAVVAATSAYARINARGQWVQRSETVNLNKLFERMTQAELEKYAQDGSLPEWFPSTVGAGDEATEPDEPEPIESKD